MPQIGTWLLANIFTALLPPQDKDEEDFYAILGTPRNANNEQIRKAFKVQSLKLHPDKVAQRKQSNAEDAAARYEQVQEAYHVLVNEEKRQKYHALQCSPTRYRFVNQGAFGSPGTIYENLTNASTVDKTRLVILCTVIILTLFMQPILIATKVNHDLEGGTLDSVKWITVLVPTWTMGGLCVIFNCIMVVVAPAESKLSLAAVALEYAYWYVGLVLLAMKWDGALSGSYAQIFTPMFLAMATRWLSKVGLLLTIRRDVARMVTVEYLERKVLLGKTLEDLTEDEQENIRKTYLVVTVPPDFVPDLENTESRTPDENGEVDKEELLELQKVEASSEYDTAMDLYFSTMGSLAGSLVFGLIFMVVLTLKLDRQIEASYWVVFIPVWIHYGSRWLYFCFQCACGTVSGDEIVMHMEQQRREQYVAGDEETGDAEAAEMHPIGSVERPEVSGFFEVNANVNNEKRAAADSATTVPKSMESAPRSNKGEAKATVTPEPTENPSIGKGFGEAKPAAGDNDEGGIHIDEETFHAWQSAYEEAERGAMEEQAKASAECCSLTVQLMVLIMLVAKIDDSYWDSDESSHPGFNTFWILFPFFLFFGLILCCCACIIYGAEPGKASDFMESAGVQTTPVNEATAASEPIIPTPPQDGEETKEMLASETLTSLDAEEDVKPAAKVPDMEELD